MRIILPIIAMILYSNLLLAESGTIKTTVSLIFFSDFEMKESDMKTFFKTSEKNLSGYTGFEYVPVEILMDRKGFVSFSSDLKKVLRFISEGKLHYENMDFDNSMASFSKAIQTLEKNHLFANKRRMYIEALSYAGAISVLSNKTDAAYNYFRQILTIEPKHLLDPNTFPPQITEFFKKVSKEVQSSPRCIIKFKTEPEKSQVFLNGKFSGVSPFDKTSLVCGNHHYYIINAGYYPSSGSINISPDKIAGEVNETLSATNDLQLIDNLQTSIRQNIETDEYPSALSSLSDVDQIITIYATGSREKPQMVGALYDNIGKIKINSQSVSLSKPMSDSAQEIDSFITSIYLDIGGRKIITQTMIPTLGSSENIAEKEKPKPTHQEKQVYEKWWFWIAIIGSIAILITVPVVLINSADPVSRSPDEHTDPFLKR